MRSVFLALLIAAGFCKQTYAQESEKERTVGLTASLQQGDLGIRFPIWISNNFVLAPGISAVIAQNAGTDISIGLSPRYYFRTEKLAPYIGLNLGAAFLKKKAVQLPFMPVQPEEPVYTDVFGGFAFGADYFFVPQFSMGLEAQGNITKSHAKSQRFGNPGNLNFNTGTMISASIYF